MKDRKGICVKCKKHFEIVEMEVDHINPWHEGGKTVAGNCQMLCKQDKELSLENKYDFGREN